MKDLVTMTNMYANERGFGPRFFHSPEVGFAIYHINSDGECYIEEIYVLPEKRRSHAASSMADAVADIALKFGCNRLTGSVAHEDPAAERNRVVLGAYGMKKTHSTDDTDYFEKVLNG